MKQAVSVIPRFGQIQFCKDIKECTRELGDERTRDIIFLANRLGKDNIKTFVEAAKAMKAGEDTAYVLVLGTADQDNSTIANAVLYGVDGFLLEPFSVDNLAEITELAQKVKGERSAEREMKAFGFLLKDVMKQIDRCAFIKSCDFDVGQNMKKLTDMTQTFRDLNEAKLEMYYEAAVIEFGKSQVPELPEGADKYKGVSSRVKKRMEQKIVQQMLEEAEQDEKRRAG